MQFAEIQKMQYDDKETGRSVVVIADWPNKPPILRRLLLKERAIMEKNNIYKFLYAISALLVLGFAISFGVDIYKYNNNMYMSSAPLYAYAIVRAVTFIVPSIIVFIVALIVKKKLTNKEYYK